MKRALFAAIALATACTVPPPRPPAIDPTPTIIVGRDAEFTATCSHIWLEELGRAIDPPALAACLDQARHGVTGETMQGWVHDQPESLAWRNRPKHNDPLKASVDELRRWRGAISTVLAPLPCGPRPGQPDNVLFTAQYDSPCWAADDRQRARDVYAPLTHWAIGPIVQKGYRGRYPDTDWSADVTPFLDRLEELWDNRGADGELRAPLIPAVFLLPDTGFCANGSDIDRACVERVLTPIYSQPRFQALARIVVLAWEPNYTADDWLWGARWMARVFPRARRFIHMEGGHGAPCRGYELAEAGGPYANEAACWRPVQPYIHGFLMQDTWTYGGDVGCQKDNPTICRTPLEQHLYNLWDMGTRFARLRGELLPTCADERPCDLVDFEYASYYVTNHSSQAATARQWGDAALTAPALFDRVERIQIHAAPFVVGYGDGGTVR